MTPLEQAEKVVLALLCQPNEDLSEGIRVAIVQATNDEVEKRREVEAQVDALRTTYEDMVLGRLRAQSVVRDVRHGLAEIRRELADIALTLGESSA